MDTFLNPNGLFNQYRQLIVHYKYIVVLILANFITNYLFILQYKFYSDDWTVIVHTGYPWTESYGYLLLTPGRPIYWAIFKFQAQIFQNYALLHHIIGFITTSIVLILIYEIIKKIFSDFNYPSEVYPFLTAIIYCVLFNKDEMYPWVVMAFAGYSILYLVSFYTYIHKEKKYYLGYSIIAYSLGIFTYESGIGLPIIFFAYDLLLKKDFKKSFIFAVPLLFNLLVRKTSWFGYGAEAQIWGNNLGGLGFQSILNNTFDFVSASFFLIVRQILYALHGLQALGILLFLIMAINIIIIYIFYVVLNFEGISNKGNLNLVLFAVIITASFAAPYLLRGGLLSGSLPTRSFEFIDIGIALILTIMVLGCPLKSQHQKILVLITIGICVFLCQGLYINWVISGDIQDDVYHYIGEHMEVIQPNDYIYFNTSSFVQNRPNAIDESIFYPIAKIYFQYIRNDPESLDRRIQLLKQKNNGSLIDNEYDRYFNAKCLDNYALASMLSAKNKKFDNRNYEKYLIYGKSINVPLKVTNEYIIFQQPFPGGQNITIARSRIYEINYDDVYLNHTPA